MILTSFAPVIAPNASVLILGSMPGSQSLRLGQYYGHPQNLFWPFMGEIMSALPSLPYAERLALLQSAGIGLWDVLKHCEREGSLDADIVPATEVPNDFAWLFGNYPSLHRVCFNGKKAAQAFQRHVVSTLPPALFAPLTLISLPSTSPANRSITTEVKLTLWRTAILDGLSRAT